MHVLNRETAEDLTSDIFMKVIAAYDRYDPERADERTWLSAIANRILIDHYRSRARNRADLVEDAILATIPDEKDPLEEVHDPTNDIVRQLLSKLAPEERLLLEMRYLMDMKNPQIAESLGINAKAVSERLRRLLKKCRTIVQDEGLPLEFPEIFF